jgi:hypothetical protein
MNWLTYNILAMEHLLLLQLSAVEECILWILRMQTQFIYSLDTLKLLAYIAMVL